MAPDRVGDVIAIPEARSAAPTVAARTTPPEAVGRPETTSQVRVLVASALVLTGARVPVIWGIVPGLIVAVVLLPLWVPALRRYRGATLLIALGTIALLNGWWLTQWSRVDHHVDLQLAMSTTALLAGVIGGAGVILWAREHLADAWVGVWLALGLVGAELIHRSQWGTNPWKFAFVVPVSLLVLSLARASGRRAVELVALVGLAGICVTEDSRSAFALFILAASLTLWQMPAGPSFAVRGSWRRTARTLLLIGAVATAVYNVGTALVLEGSLGEAAQARTTEQIQRSGSLLLGGRPELAATTALMAERPLGLGPGTLPSSHEVLVAKAGMEAINYDTNNGYVKNFMFGTQLRLHSVFGELWAFFGLPGLALALCIVVITVGTLASTVSRRTAGAVAIWLTCLTLWNVGFGPLFGSAAALLATLGLVPVRRRPRLS